MRKSHPGLLEIKIHNPSKMNAISSVHEQKLAELVNAAQDDEKIKVILLHGGWFFTSGNDLGMFMVKPEEFSAMMKKAKHAVNDILYDFLMTLNNSKKPIVTVVRGAAIGIGFTLTAHSTFIYCSPEARFMTPFMKSG